jgi:acyl carrier protein
MLQRIKNVLSKVIANEHFAINLTDDADLINDVGLDSLQMIDFLIEIEEEFDIELDYASLNYSDMRSIQDFGSFLASHLNKE